MMRRASSSCARARGPVLVSPWRVERRLASTTANAVAAAAASTTPTLSALRQPSKRGVKRLSLKQQGLSQPGDRLGGFAVQNVTYIKDYDFTLVQLRHVESGASVFHVDTDDTNNSFAVTFRTPAQESTGVAHILEHTVLCGSARFPVRDPFFKMLKRSMNTFMNAMTAQYYTTYPFSTVIEQDFHNLLDVYLDATFFPLLRHTDFLQEGHRLERVEASAEAAAPSTLRLKRTGVVYNEMKGALSDASSIFMQQVQRDLYGETFLGHCSGGDWKHIPDLTYARLVDFHRTCYQPSNACFVTYGDLPLANTLDKIEHQVLSKFPTPQQQQQQQPQQHRLGETALPNRAPSSVIVPGAASSPTFSQLLSASKPSLALKKNVHLFVPAEHETDDKLKVLRSWVCPSFTATDYYQSTVGSVLGVLLTDVQSPVYSKLIDAQVAPQYAPGTGFEAHNFFPCFGFGAQGMTDVEAAERAIEAGLEEARVLGFSPERVNAVIHQMELDIRHKRANFGLKCCSAASTAWVNGGDTVVASTFKSTELIQQLKANSSDAYWKKLVEDWVVAGWHDFGVRAVATPSKVLVQEEAEQEEAQLRQVLERLSADDLARIDVANAQLAEERAKPEDIALLPSLNVARDVPLVSPETIRITVSEGKTSKAPLERVVDQKTNGVTYFRSFFDTSQLTQHPKLFQLSNLLPILLSCLGSVDAADRDYRQLHLALESTGGTLSCSTALNTWLGPDFEMKRKSPTEEGVLVSFDCLTPNCTRAFREVLGDVLTASNFNSNEGQRLQVLLAQTAQSLTSSLPQNAHGYASAIAKAPHSRVFDLQERFSGFSFYQLIQNTHKAGLPGAQALAPVLQSLASWVFSSATNPRGSFVDSEDESRPAVDAFMSRIVSRPAPAFDESSLSASLDALRDMGIISDSVWAKHSRHTYLSVEVPIHYCHATVQTPVTFGHVDDCALELLSILASNDFLHQHVREKGGAYGARCSFNAQGMMSFSSYWDPNSVATLEAYGECLRWLCETKFTEKQVDEALLSVFGGEDAPTSPGRKGLGIFLKGITQEMRDARREKYLDLVGSAGVSKLQQVAQKYLAKVDSFVQVKAGGIANETCRTSVCIAGNVETSKSFENIPGWRVL